MNKKYWDFRICLRNHECYDLWKNEFKRTKEIWMIKSSLKIINDSIKCSLCEKEGHKLNYVIVKNKDVYRTPKFCICCESPSIRENLGDMLDRKQSVNSSSY
jgi:hypothetical protein